MASILPGYQYDIFISYRQKDNRSDQWVTNFVKALREELDATFKEEISIYFDANPHDGLLETHDVDGSLKEKIKCLVFIPIVSQTYCDPKSFAWQKEFLAFVDFAKSDQYGLDIKLSNGNVAKRVLPVRIHEIDESDKKLFKDAIGGVMRPIDFVYKSPGVNRPLQKSDDDRQAGQVLFQDQVNKVANAIKEIIAGLRGDASGKVSIENLTYSASKSSQTSTKTRLVKKISIPRTKVALSIPLILITLVGVALLFYFLSWQLTHKEEPKTITSFTIPLPNDVLYVDGITISPDGTTISYVTNYGALRSKLFVRKLENFESIEFPDKDPDHPTFSPDSKWLVYASDKKLIKYSIANQTKVEICTLPLNGVNGITWGDDENLYFGNGYPLKDLMRVSSAGGKAEILLQSHGKLNFNHPSNISGSKDFIFCATDLATAFRDSRIAVGRVGSNEWKDLGINGFSPQIHSSGLLTYHANRGIMVTTYNISEKQINQSKITRVLDQVGPEEQFALAENGTIVYIPLYNASADNLVFTGKGGTQEVLSIEGMSSRIYNPKMSPDGKKISFLDSKQMLCVYDLQRKTLEKIPSWNWSNNVWSADSKYLYYHGNLIRGRYSIFAWKVNSNEPPQEIYTSDLNIIPSSISKDGELLILDGVGYTGIYMLDLKTKTLLPYLQSEFRLCGAQISPDGKWMAYHSSESGQSEIYVGSISNAKDKWLISSGGGVEPIWSIDGKQVFYRSANNFEAVNIQTGNTVEILGRETLFTDKMERHQYFETNYDLTADGKKFLGIMARPSGTPEIRVVLNWYEQIKNNFE